MSSTPSPKDWLILQCQACGSPMKVRAETVVNQRVACPVCRSPVAPPQEAGESVITTPEFRAHMPQDADRVSPRQERRVEERTDAEFAPSPIVRQEPGTVPAEEPAAEDSFLTGLKSTEGHHSSTRVKVKKRRKNAAPNHYQVLTDWDTSLESLPEAELYSDPWTASVPIPEEVIKSKTRDYVVEGQDEDGAAVRRVKRVRKRRLFSWAQLFFRRLSMGMRILTSTVVVAIAVGGLYYGVKIFKEHFKPVSYDETAAQTRTDRRILVQQDESGAFDAVKAFLAAKGTEAKLPYVRLPKRVRPLMEKYYGRSDDRPLEAVEVTDRDKVATQGSYFVRLEVEVKDPNSPGNFGFVRHFAVEEVEDKGGHRTYLVDWETAVEYREMSFDDFKKDQPKGNVPFRIKLRGSDYYNHSFTDQKKWFATEVYFPHPGAAGNETLFYGYLDRNTEVYRKLADTLESGLSPSVIVNIRFPANSISPDQVIIDSLIRDSWFFTEDIPAR